MGKEQLRAYMKAEKVEWISDLSGRKSQTCPCERNLRGHGDGVYSMLPPSLFLRVAASGWRSGSKPDGHWCHGFSSAVRSAASGVGRVLSSGRDHWLKHGGVRPITDENNSNHLASPHFRREETFLGFGVSSRKP
jgi:hypothetical protein